MASKENLKSRTKYTRCRMFGTIRCADASFLVKCMLEEVLHSKNTDITIESIVDNKSLRDAIY